MDPAAFVVLDETGATTSMVRRSGWGPEGERRVAAAPHGHWRTTTFVAGSRGTGLIAPLVLAGPRTGEALRAHVGQVLAPGLAPGDVVVMDHLAAREQRRCSPAGVPAAIAAAGAGILYPPPSSPDLNPIERLFAELAALLRKAAARTRDAPWETIGRLREAFSPAECRNYIENTGYAFD